MHGLFRFRQDLRLSDSVGLIETIKKNQSTTCIFIFDTTILSHFPQRDLRLGFLIDCVKKLEKDLRNKGYNLIVEVGDPCQIIPVIIKKNNITNLGCNKSYGIGSLARDLKIQEWCKTEGIDYQSYSDYLLIEPNELEQRKVFTPFYKLRQKKLVEKIDFINLPATHFANHCLPDQDKKNGVNDECNWDLIESQLSFSENTCRPIDGWKQSFDKSMTDYEETRNIPSFDGTTKISPYLRFGLVSIRQVYERYKDNPTIISELARREFWHHIIFYFPKTRIVEFQEKRRGIQRENNKELFEKWCKGETGYPIVDAGMKQLVQEKRMHGRTRMIVASFLTKDLLIDWRRGEEFFKQHLLDYDSCVNIGNRQRSASVGADPKPLRIFSPILQSQRFDPQARYIKKYLPELADIEAYRLHDPLTYRIPYHAPIVDHVFAQKRARERYTNFP